MILSAKWNLFSQIFWKIKYKERTRVWLSLGRFLIDKIEQLVLPFAFYFHVRIIFCRMHIVFARPPSHPPRPLFPHGGGAGPDADLLWTLAGWLTGWPASVSYILCFDLVLVLVLVRSCLAVWPVSWRHPPVQHRPAQCTSFILIASRSRFIYYVSGLFTTREKKSADEFVGRIPGQIAGLELDSSQPQAIWFTPNQTAHNLYHILIIPLV